MFARMLLLSLFAAVPLGVGLLTTPCTAQSDDAASDLVEQAVSEQSDLSDKGILALRAQGPAGLDGLFVLRDATTSALQSVSDADQWRQLTDRLARIDRAIDAVGGQLHCSVSRLYWYTDFAEAQAAARASGKPILSLRLLGALTQECSCANSRFFRTALYSNAEISAVMWENFVLHWETVRPVPVITIDFGDGRVLQRTITGNSAHYLLDAEGHPLDVLPGLYGPGAFQRWLESSAALVELYTDWMASRQDSHRSTDSLRRQFLAEYHLMRLDAVTAALAADLAAIGYDGPPIFTDAEGSDPIDIEAESITPDGPPLLGNGPTLILGTDATGALTADLDLPFPKTTFEAPALRSMAPVPQAAVLADIAPEAMGRIDGATWGQIAALHTEEARLDHASVDLIRRENPTATQAGELARSKMEVEDPILRLVRNFQTSMAVDTVRNEYVFHRQIHQWFVDHSAGQDRQALNERVYAELFLTPSSDPWLGLVPADTYSALPNNGLVTDHEQLNIGGWTLD